MFTENGARKLGTLVVTCIGFFMVLLDASIVTVALPTIQSTLHTQLADLQWVVDAYTLPFAVLLLTAGTLGDRFGRKRVFLVGLIVFTIGSGICGFAPTLDWLIAGRVVQGVGGAALSPGSLSVLAAAFPHPRERAQAIGVWSGVSGIALAAGPLLGGVLIQVLGWQAIFFVNLPIGALALALGLWVLAESRNPAAHRLDLLGQALVIAGLTALTYALIQGQSDGWDSTKILALFATSAVLLITFLIVEARIADPLLPLSFFRSVVFSTANVAALIVGFALLGTVFFIAQYFQEVQGYTALQSGERTLPNTMGIFLMAPLAGRFTARFGPRLPIALGAVFSSVALLSLTSLTPTTAYGEIWWRLGLLGIGFGLMLSPITSAVLAATPPARAGLASSMVNSSRQLGSVLGIAVLGAVVEHQEASNLVNNLIHLHLPAQSSETLSAAIATAGAAPGRLHLSGKLPFPRSVLHEVIGSSFTNALHPSFVISAVALLCAAILAAALLGRGGQVTTQAMTQAMTRDAPIAERAVQLPAPPETRKVAHRT